MDGKQLRAIREKLGLTQAELADRLDVNRVTVARWETEAIAIDRRTELAVKFLAMKG